MTTRNALRLCRVDDIELDGMKRVNVPGHGDALCVYRTAEGVFVTDDTCTHGLASLSEGDVEDGVVRCPYHGGAFDIRTGAAVESPCVDPIRTYTAWIEDGQVVAALDVGAAD